MKKRQWKGESEIGFRAYTEILRIFPGTTEAVRALGIRSNNLYLWKDGVCPSAKYLARLLKAGADIEYILIGRKKDSA
jgi:hypothetical protein